MNGPQHYREAERLLNALDVVGNPTPAQVLQMQTAGVHATLALAAATALNDADGGTSPNDYRAWRRVGSVELADEGEDC